MARLTRSGSRWDLMKDIRRLSDVLRSSVVVVRSVLADRDVELGGCENGGEGDSSG